MKIKQSYRFENKGVAIIKLETAGEKKTKRERNV